jgi:hypothetical protein
MWPLASAGQIQFYGHAPRRFAGNVRRPATR